MSERDEPVTSDLLCELDKPDYRVCLQLANNRMECRADLIILQTEPEPETETTSPPRSLPAYELINLLLQHNIRHNIDFAALYNFCAAVEGGSEQTSVLLATGTAPQTGEDGWFELVVKTSGNDAAFVEDEKGRIDLRTRHAYTEIEVGQKIGILHQPRDGIPGTAVDGSPIPAERGRIYSLVAGEGVEMKFDGRVAFASRSGRSLLERQVLAVVDQLVISGDLDLEVGNVNFNGFVEVKGDVRDDFHIKATKGIKVGGVVGACQLESGGLVEIGSMAGKESGKIICHGDLTAGFLNQVNVQCFADVLITNEIRNSIVKATGKIVVERGPIIGGSCIALKGIEAKILGATSGLETRLVAGIYFPDADRFNFLYQRLQSIEEQIRRLKSAIGPLQKLSDLDETTGKRLAILGEQWEKLEVERDELLAELEASTRQERETSNPKINVGSRLFDGVHITLGNSSHKYTMVRSGPLSIIENTKKGGFHYLSLSPLTKPAAELEIEEMAVAAAEEDETPAAAGAGS